MASEARIGIRSDSKQAEGDIKGIRGLLQKLGQDAKGSILTGVGLGAGVTAFNVLSNAVRGAVDYVGDAVNAARDLAESQNKVNVVFGQSAEEIEDWASTSASALGQSSQQALEAAGTYGNLFQAFGLGREESAKMSVSLVELAADLASFNNTPVDDALVALRSGLSGETEPLKRFGIALNDARMRAVLAAQGVTNLGATLTASQKATAAYTIIMQDSALAQGDFERTSEGLANQQRILEAELENLSAEIGQELLPAVLELTRAAADLVPQLVALIDPVLTFTGAIGDVLNPMGNLADHFRDLADEQEEHAERASEANRGWVADMAAAVPAAETAASDLAGALPAELAEARDAAKEIVRLTLKDLVDSLVTGQTAWQDAWDEYGQIMETDLTEAEELAELKAILTGQKLADGLNSTDPERRAAAQLMYQTVMDRIFALEHDVPESASATGTGYTEALRQKRFAVQDAAAEWAKILRDTTAVNLYGQGQNAGGSFGQGLASTSSYVFTVAQQLKNTVKHALEFAGSPPYTESKKIGAMVAKTFGEGFASEAVRLPDLSGMLSGGRTSGFTSGLAPAPAMGAPIEIHTHLSIDGREITEIVDRQHYYMAPTTALYPKG